MATLRVHSDTRPDLHVTLDQTTNGDRWHGKCNAPGCRWKLSLRESYSLDDSRKEAAQHVDHEH